MCLIVEFIFDASMVIDEGMAEEQEEEEEEEGIAGKLFVRCARFTCNGQKRLFIY